MYGAPLRRRGNEGGDGIEMEAGQKGDKVLALLLPGLPRDPISEVSRKTLERTCSSTFPNVCVLLEAVPWHVSWAKPDLAAAESKINLRRIIAMNMKVAVGGVVTQMFGIFCRDHYYT